MSEKKLTPKEVYDLIIKEKDLNSYRELSIKAGILYQSIADAVHGKINISQKVADKILSMYPDISRSWIITGEGEMYKNAVTQHNVHGDNINGNNVTVNKESKEKKDVQCSFNENDIQELGKIVSRLSQQLATKDEQIMFQLKHINQLLSIMEGMQKQLNEK